MAARMLVEGQDDKHVIQQLLRQHGIEMADVKDKGGISILLEELPVELKARDIDRLAIVVDADEGLASRWQRLRQIMRDSGYDSMPGSPDPAGTVMQADLVVGIWVMPDNQAKGILEDFVAQLVPQGDQLWTIARRAVAALPEQKFKHPPKAEICTWLAWQEKPGVKMGAAISQRCLSSSTAAAEGFVQWVRRLLAE